ncbi:MAG: TonB-dependent receptor [Prevotellaceae bacterium]|jgi:outer membrane receptor for ferrienterochelin and colicin|nr:TonB-dependent receptor [Prevotellaceae bacterium]
MKLQLLKIFFTVLCCVSSVIANGQISVKGTIVDRLTKEPIAGAVVIAKDADAVTVSQINGFFRLHLAQGTQKIMITLVGYIPKEIDITNVADLGIIELESDALELESVMIVSSFAKDRETPVALSTIKPGIITEKLGSKEFPEILRSTPSIYVSKSGGGYGDSRINLRGFDSNNIGILVNGVPVNDMENGKVYWTNWAGLADVARMIQIQRGMGASKLAISSVGGTINIITKNTDAEKGGSVYSGIGNDGYNKYSFSLSSGLMENGWAITVSGGTSFGDGYIDGTNFKAYSYFANISKVISHNHRLSLQAFGAPQWHNQRGSQHEIATYKNENSDIPFYIKNKKFNSDYGYRNGKVYGGNYGYNKYHKPQISLNHYWDIDETSMLSTAAYASVGTGGGRRISGAQSSLMRWGHTVWPTSADWREKLYYDRPAKEDALITPEGFWDYDAAIALNQNSETGSEIIVSNAFNNHEWYGLLSSYNKAINYLKITAGVDAKYYIGKHGMEVVDLLGGKYYLDNANNVNRPATTQLKVGDKFSYHNDGIVSWLGVFGQVEYMKEKYSAFVSVSVASNNYRRKDYFNYTEGNQLSDKVNFVPFSVKGGFNYNFDKYHNLFINAGYFTRAPYFDNAFLNYKNIINTDAKMEKIVSGEIGYGFISSIFRAKLNAYITNWKDKTFLYSKDDITFNIPGLNALHKGIELEVQFNPVSRLMITGMCSLGDWIWQNDVNFKVFNNEQVLDHESNAYIKGIHVGNSAQHTAFLGVDYDVFKSVRIGANINYFGKHFAEFDPINRKSADNDGDAWRLPDVIVTDFNVCWKFNIGNLNATLYGNIDNLFDKEYISDATDGNNHDMNTARVYYGFGRTWTTGVRINF